MHDLVILLLHWQISETMNEADINKKHSPPFIDRSGKAGEPTNAALDSKAHTKKKSE